MFNKLLSLVITTSISFLLIPNTSPQAGGITRNQVLKHAMKLNQVINFSQQPVVPQVSQQRPNSQLVETNTYYNAELWQTYQRLQKQTEMVPTRSAIAVYVGMQTIMGSQQQPLRQINQPSEGNNSARFAKDALIFLRKHGYLQYFSQPQS